MFRFFLVTLLILFGLVSLAALLKQQRLEPPPMVLPPEELLVEIDLEEEGEPEIQRLSGSMLPREEIEEVDLTDSLFNPRAGKKFPFIQTISYKSRVPWLKGRPAWISDYATRYRTSRHFIARSLHGKGCYFKHDVANGNLFNVFNPDEPLEFHLLIDLSRCKLWLFALLPEKGERFLIKTYDVGLGRRDETSPSGLLTPMGKYTLGNRLATYEPKTLGYHNGEKVEMVRIFGTRWIPFGREVAETTAPAAGYGIHGVPWQDDPKTGEMVEKKESIGSYSSDGCIRLATEDIEEIYSIVTTKPSIVQLVRDYREAELPGREVAW